MIHDLFKEAGWSWLPIKVTLAIVACVVVFLVLFTEKGMEVFASLVFAAMVLTIAGLVILGVWQGIGALFGI